MMTDEQISALMNNLDDIKLFSLMNGASIFVDEESNIKFEDGFIKIERYNGDSWYPAGSVIGVTFKKENEYDMDSESFFN